MVTSCVLGVWRPALLIHPQRDEQLWVGEGHGKPGPGEQELRNSILRNYALSSLKCKRVGDFPDGPVVKNQPCDAGDAGLIPGWGTKIPHATGLMPQLWSLRAATKAPT